MATLWPESDTTTNPIGHYARSLSNKEPHLNPGANSADSIELEIQAGTSTELVVRDESCNKDCEDHVYEQIDYHHLQPALLHYDTSDDRSRQRKPTLETKHVQKPTSVNSETAGTYTYSTSNNEEHVTSVTVTIDLSSRGGINESHSGSSCKLERTSMPIDSSDKDSGHETQSARFATWNFIPTSDCSHHSVSSKSYNSNVSEQHDESGESQHTHDQSTDRDIAECPPAYYETIVSPPLYQSEFYNPPDHDSESDDHYESPVVDTVAVTMEEDVYEDIEETVDERKARERSLLLRQYGHQSLLNFSLCGIVIAVLTLNIPGLICLIPAAKSSWKAIQYSHDGDRIRARFHHRLAIGCNVIFWLYGFFLLLIITPLSIILGLVYGLSDACSNTSSAGNVVASTTTDGTTDCDFDGACEEGGCCYCDCCDANACDGNCCDCGDDCCTCDCGEGCCDDDCCSFSETS